VFVEVQCIASLLQIKIKNMEHQDLLALFKASCGLYVLSAKNGEKDNACIIDTFMQVTTNEPIGCIISVNKKNYTTEMIAETQKFNLSVLTTDAPLELFKRFGYQSGHEVDKFKGFTDFDRSENGLIFLTKHANALLSFDVLDTIDFDTHVLLKATLTESAVLNNKESITYDYYQQYVKSKPQIAEKAGYRCTICGYVYGGDEPPPSDYFCLVCHNDATYFVKV